MFKVETYTNPLTFYNSLEIGMDELHVTSIPVLAMHMKKKAEGKGKYLKSNVMIYHHFYSALYPKWVSKKYMLDMKQVLRGIIRTQERFQDYRELLLKQVDSLIESYRYWLTLGLTQMKSEYSDTEFEQIKVELYHAFKAHEVIIKGYETLQQPLSYEYISNCLNKFAEQKMRVGQGHLNSISKIYIYALSDLNPIRLSFFEKLKEVGYEIIFRIPYDSKYPHVYEGWVKLYRELVPQEKWKKLEESVIDSPILEFLEGNQKVASKSRKIVLHEYREPTTFKNYLNKNKLHKDKLEILACEKDQMNEIFRDEIDEEKEISHIYETPIGRFMHNLYGIQIIEGNKRMTYKMYLEMITSGVINRNQTKDKIISGIEGNSLLSDLALYMEGTNSLEEILDRLSKLKKLYEVSEQFDELARSKVDRNHVKRYLQNPIRVFGFMNSQGYDLTINQLIMLTEELDKQVSILLGEKSPKVSIQEHIAYLIDLICHSQAYLGVDEMKDIHKLGIKGTYEEFFNRLRQFKVVIYEPEEMIEYIGVLGKIQSIKEKTGELVLIKGIEHALGVCVNGVEEVYLCDLSTTSMNHYIRRKQNKIELRSIDGVNKYIERLDDSLQKEKLQKMMNITSLVKRYLQSFIKFNLMTLLAYYPGTLHLGWINNIYPYDTEWYLLSIIKQLYEVESLQIEKVDIDWLEETIEEEQTKDELSKEAREELIKQLSPFAWEDIKQCKKKFYYSNILNHYPSYYETFNQRIVFGWIGKMFTEQYDGREQVRKQLFPLFPQWPESLKQNLVDTTPQCQMKEYISFDNIKFPKSMVSLWCLGKRKYEDISLSEKHELLKQYWNRCGHKEEVDQTKLKCYFCPHQLICQEGVLGIDREY